MPPSDSLPPSATAPVPLASGLPRCGRLFYAPWADDTCARLCVVRRRRVTGSPQDRNVSRRGEGLPGYGAVLFIRAMAEHPAGYTPLLAPQTFPQGDVVAFESNRTLGIREDERFRGRMPHGPHVRLPTHRRPCLHDRRQAGYRLGRAHPWPGRMRTCWTTNKVSWRHRLLQFPLTHRAWSHYFTYPHNPFMSTRDFAYLQKFFQPVECLDRGRKVLYPLNQCLWGAEDSRPQGGDTHIPIIHDQFGD